MAEDASSKRLPAGQRGKLTEFGKRFHADHRVVTPIAASAELPEIQTADEKRPIEPHRKLLEARENGNSADQLRRRLQDAEPRIRLHHLGHFHDVRAVHQAVGIQHQHALVAAAPGPHEIADVARLAVVVRLTAPVVDFPEALEPAAEVRPRHLLQHPEIEIPGVAEDEKVERIEMTRGLDRAVDCLDAGAEFRAVLVVHRHHHRVAFPQHRRRALGEFRDPHRAPPPSDDVPRSEKRMERTEGEQPVKDRKDHDQRDVGAVQPRAPEKVGDP